MNWSHPLRRVLAPLEEALMQKKTRVNTRAVTRVLPRPFPAASERPAGAGSIRSGVKFGPLERIDLGRMADACRERWWNQTLCRVNESVVRLGVFQGEFHWRNNDREDEFFYVVEGKLLLDLEGRTVELGARQGFVVPRGVLHRTRATTRTVVLMVGSATIDPARD